MAHNPSDLRIEIITSLRDVLPAFICTRNTFGNQTHDGIWLAMNPECDTPEGISRGAQRMTKRWLEAVKARNNDGNLNTIFLKATVPDPEKPGEHRLVGIAIWVQASAVEGHGDVPAEDLSAVLDLEALYPGNKTEQRYLVQLDRSLHRKRIEVVKEKATASPPAVMVLDLCAVDPAYQGKGIAKKLVQWGLDEASRRGGLEAITEASSMGRHVYAKLGFKPDETEIVYDVDAEFAGRERPSNLFMRTGP
ncbi:hypothetical protein B0T10DRAFT_479826 [Thelonectria olida]|uniref:N-acetyltransferase domain-containing protein n=1 Tax=Thelonectria olida TaxID=1576542 RepID=A0A9P8WDL8_9HYPO|nr:hypothetical protein B0T10DRAFT_479826 [Thelonectria olida]